MSDPKLDSLTELHNERWEIRKFPDDWDVTYNSTDIVNNYMENLKNAHNKYIQELDEKMKAINTALEADFRMNAQAIKHDLGMLKEVAHGILTDFAKFPKDASKFEFSKFQQGRQKCIELTELAKTKIDHFAESLQELELRRIRKYRKVLKDCSSQIDDLGYHSVRRNRAYFSKRLSTIKETVNGNIDEYRNLRLKLTQSFSSRMHHIFHETVKREESWRDLCKEQNKRKKLGFFRKIARIFRSSIKRD